MHAALVNFFQNLYAESIFKSFYSPRNLNPKFFVVDFNYSCNLIKCVDYDYCARRK